MKNENEVSEELYERFMEAKKCRDRACDTYHAIREQIITQAGSFKYKIFLRLNGKNVLKLLKYDRHVFYPSRLRKEHPKLYERYAEKKEYCTISEIKSRKKKHENR